MSVQSLLHVSKQRASPAHFNASLQELYIMKMLLHRFEELQLRRNRHISQGRKFDTKFGKSDTQAQHGCIILRQRSEGK